jgi:hypothetical protein
VGLSSVKRYVAAYREGRSLAPKKLPGSKPKLDKVASIATMVLATSRLAARFVELLGVACSTLLAGAERQRLQVSTNQLPVPDVLFPERSLQRVLFSKNVPVDDPCHDWK